MSIKDELVSHFDQFPSIFRTYPSPPRKRGPRATARRLPLVPAFAGTTISRPLLARLFEADRGPLLDRGAQIPGVAGEEDGDAVVVLGGGGRVLDAEPFELAAVAGIEPARRLKRSAVETGGEVIFGSKPRGQHVELQRADDADDPVRAVERLEDTGHPLLGQLPEGVLQMLRLHRVLDLDPPQDLRREIRDAGDAHRLTLGQGVADPEAPVVGDADDVAGPGLLGEVALARQ